MLDAAAGHEAVHPFAVRRARFAATRPLPVGAPYPHGEPAVADDRLAVPVDHGIALVPLDDSPADPQLIRLETTPSDVLVTSGGAIFAALPSSNAIAVVEPDAPDATRYPEVKGRPFALAAAANDTTVVYVLTASTQTLLTLDPATGEVRERVPVRALQRGVVAPLVATSVGVTTSGLVTTVVLQFAGGRIGDGELVTLDPAFRDGSLAYEVRQPGIRVGTTRRSDRANDVTAAVSQGTGLVRLRLAFPGGAFTSAAMTSGPRSVTVRLRSRPRRRRPPRADGRRWRRRDPLLHANHAYHAYDANDAHHADAVGWRHVRHAAVSGGLNTSSPAVRDGA